MSHRRHFIGIAAACLAALVTPSIHAQQSKIVVSSAGGVVGEAAKKAFFVPFTAATGIAVEHVSTEQQRMAQLEAMSRAGSVSWDVMEISASDYPIGVKRALFEKIDYSKADPQGVLPAVARQPYGVAASTYSDVLVVRNDKLPAGKKMASWADFWDVKSFPGPRMLSARPQSNLEFALLADGVPSKDLYKVLATKEGQDRAFRKLDQIKPFITRWWKSGAESVQLLNDGEAFFGTTFNGRVGVLQKGGIPVEIVWNGGALHTSYVGIPKGSKNIDDAYKYIHFRSTNVAAMRTYMAILPYPGFAPGVYDGLPPDVTRQMPTFPANAAAQFNADEDFWAQHISKIQERWNEWMLM